MHMILSTIASRFIRALWVFRVKLNEPVDEFSYRIIRHFSLGAPHMLGVSVVIKPFQLEIQKEASPAGTEILCTKSHILWAFFTSTVDRIVTNL